MSILKNLCYLILLGMLGGLWACQIGVTVCKSGIECSLKQRCIDKRCQVPPQENNRPPIARAGVNQRVKKGGRVRLDGSTSSDADLDRLSYQWTFSKRPKGSKAVLENASNPQASFVADIPGAFEVKLTVTDGLGSSDDDSITIRANFPPQADAGGDQLVLPGATVALKGGDSWDPDVEDTLSYQWKLIKKPSGSKAVLRTASQEVSTFFVDQPGIYFVELTVRDGLDQSTDNLRVQVADPKTITPRLQALDPWRAPKRSITKVALLGDNFIQGAKVFWDGKSIPVDYRSKNRVLLLLDLRTADIGAHKVKLQNPGGNETKEQLFQVDEVPKPVLSALTPKSGTAGQTVTLNIKGSGFVIGAKAYFNNKPLNTKYIEMTSLSAQTSLGGLKAGKYEVFVENEAGKRSNSQLFEVVILPPKPAIYNHRFLQKLGGTTSTGTIDTDYEYLRLYARGLLSTTQVFINGNRYSGKKEVQLVRGTTGSIYLSKFSTKGMKVGYMEIKLGNTSPGKVLESPTYRIKLNNPYVPTLRYPRFYEKNGRISSVISTEKDYKYVDILGTNFQGTNELFIDGKKYGGRISKRSNSFLRLESFTTKGLKVGEHSMFVRNIIKGKKYESNTIRLQLLDGRIPVISSIYSSDNTTRLYTNRNYTFLRITGYNFQANAKVIIDGIPHNGPVQYDLDRTIYMYQFSTEKFQPGSHTIVVRNVIQGRSFNSRIRVVQFQDGSTPRIRSAYFRPSSRVYQNEVYQVTMNVENVQNGAKILLDGKEYSGVIQISTNTILLPQFNTKGLSVSLHVLQIRNRLGGRSYDSNPYTFSVRKREPPRITVITPSLINQKQSAMLQVTGRYFSTNAKLFVNKKEINPSSVTTYRITATFDPSGWKLGRYEVYVQNQDGQKSNISYIYITPNLGPALFSVSPTEIHLSSDKTVSQTLLLYLYGSNINTGATIYANNKLIGTITTPTRAGSTARASISLLTLSGLSGNVNITVKNPDGKESNKTEVKLMASGKPKIYQVSPPSLYNTTRLSMYIRGRGFSPRSQVLIDGKAMANTQYAVRTSQSSPYAEQFYLRLQQSDILGYGETVKIEIRNPDGQTSPPFVLANYVVKKVTGPILSYASPGIITAGSIQATQLYLSGQNFTPSSVVLLNGKTIPASYVSSRSLRLALPTGVDIVGAYQYLQVRNNNKVSNHFPLYFRTGPVVTNITPPFLQLDTPLQTFTVFASGMSPGATLKLFGKSFSIASPSRVIITLTKQDMANIKPGLHTFQIEQPNSKHKSPTAGLHVINTTKP